jgi:hypothetical protein
MAKADNDKRTADILTGRRPVGRPPAAHGAPTAAQRKAAQRARNKAAGLEQVTVTLSAEIKAALRTRCEATATRPERTQREVIEEILYNQLCRKR